MLENVIEKLDTSMVLALGLVLLLGMIYVIGVALREGREITFWPPRIGPRVPSATKKDSKQPPPAQHEVQRRNLPLSVGGSAVNAENSTGEPSKQSLDEKSLDGTLSLTAFQNYQHELKLKELFRLQGQGEDTTTRGGTMALYEATLPEYTLGAILVHSPGKKEDVCIFLTERTLRITFGRRPSMNNYVGSDDQTMSAEHFRLEIHPVDGTDGRRQHKFILRDMGSKFGTFLDGTRVEEAELGSSALIEAGFSRFNFFIFRTTKLDMPSRVLVPLQESHKGK